MKQRTEKRKESIFIELSKSMTQSKDKEQKAGEPRVKREKLEKKDNSGQGSNTII